MRIDLVTALFLIVSTVACGQNIQFDKFTGNGSIAASFTKLRHKIGIESDLPTVGTVYLNERFMPCTIYYNSDVVGNFYYRHNAYNDEIEIKDTQYMEEEASSLVTQKELRLVDRKDHKELALKVYRNKEGEVRNGYLYKLNKGKNYTLYYKNSVKFTEGTHPVSSMVRPTPNKFTHFREYYYMAAGSRVAEYLGPRKGDFIDAVKKDLREQLKQYVKNERISLKKKEDLVATFTFLNTL